MVQQLGPNLRQEIVFVGLWMFMGAVEFSDAQH
jgi:hypothetical protein